MKLTNEQKLEIENLNNNGLKQMEIAKIIGTSQKTISYWLSSEEKRKEISKRAYEKFKNLPEERKKEIYKKRLPYIKKWMRLNYKKKTKNENN